MMQYRCPKEEGRTAVYGSPVPSPAYMLDALAGDPALGGAVRIAQSRHLQTLTVVYRVRVDTAQFSVPNSLITLKHAWMIHYEERHRVLIAIVGASECGMPSTRRAPSVSHLRRVTIHHYTRIWFCLSQDLIWAIRRPNLISPIVGGAGGDALVRMLPDCFLVSPRTLSSFGALPETARHVLTQTVCGLGGDPGTTTYLVSAAWWAPISLFSAPLGSKYDSLTNSTWSGRVTYHAYRDIMCI
ncbi:hypothetical protein SAMD00023353_4800890 [Rosellinia necatrix]|uniref:Uncharacterized protein n=1 Tax=Rosellinia necatrix TaxID=77044 RepID=A0A1S8A9Q8_ROSNE|nr:hypothetical protein SAMD00023353_4800890 [Rosellinia necatrix]